MLFCLSLTISQFSHDPTFHAYLLSKLCHIVLAAIMIVSVFAVNLFVLHTFRLLISFFLINHLASVSPSCLLSLFVLFFSSPVFYIRPLHLPLFPLPQLKSHICYPCTAFNQPPFPYSLSLSLLFFFPPLRLSSITAPVISLQALTPLLTAPSHSIRSAAAATVSKLSIKAKAFQEDSSEISVILNTVMSVLKAAAGGGDKDQG